MAPAGYDVILCRNCNRDRGAPLVAKAAYPPPLQTGQIDSAATRVNAPVDFGVTESTMLDWAYRGAVIYAKEGPFPNLRLIAKIEDPSYLLVAVKAGSAIRDLSQVKAQRLPVKILSDGQPASQAVLDYYGLSAQAVSAWGGSIVGAMRAGADADFDIVVGAVASPANNPESAFWTTLSQHHDLHFLDLPADLSGRLVQQLDMRPVTARWGLLRGVDRPIATVGRSGEAIFARADMPDQAAYDAAKAIDAHRGALLWFIRPYSYDPRTVTRNGAVPLHPGAARYYREVGYLK
jgi:TRAP transporter TAXI family solute receptor